MSSKTCGNCKVEKKVSEFIRSIAGVSDNCTACVTRENKELVVQKKKSDVKLEKRENVVKDLRKLLSDDSLSHNDFCSAVKKIGDRAGELLI